MNTDEKIKESDDVDDEKNRNEADYTERNIENKNDK
jgi:hypothetical protein